MPLTRAADWELRFARQQEKSAAQQFQWGVFDCALCACDFIQAMTSVDPAEPVRGKYSSKEQAHAIFEQNGGSLESLTEAWAKSLAMEEVGRFYARRGDLVLVDNGTPDRALAVVDLSGRFGLCASDTGIARIAVRRWLRAWRVG